MRIIGKIDADKFRQIADGIRGTDVVLTDKQVEHIIERRGEKFYREYASFFSEVIEKPDYIFRDPVHENTALVCKRVIEKGKSINLVLRLAVNRDEPGRMHSVITAIVENDRRFEQRIRNNLPIYER